MTSSHPDWADTLIDLVALAARLETEGQYNIAKLARAAADALARQAGRPQDLPTDREWLSAAVAVAADSVRQWGAGAELAEALAVGAGALAAGRLTRIDETPNPWVCRTCGFVTLTPPAAPCPTCGAWPETFQQFPPVYWLNDLEPFAAIARLRQTPAAIAAVIEGVDDAILDRKPEVGGWSVQQALGHLRDAQGVLDHRLTLILEHDNPELASLAVFEWANQENEKPPTAREVFASYREGRERLLTRLEALPLAAWWRTGRHEEFGVVSLRQQVSYFAAHESTHMHQIQALAMAKGG
jgi:uncharacterized damage-inducible protein DinB